MPFLFCKELKMDLKKLQKKTKIPFPTLKKYYQHKIKLSEKTISKINKALKNIKASENYNKARKAGLSAKEASSVKNRSKESLKKYLILRKNGVNLEKAKTEAAHITVEEAKKEADKILEYAKIIAKNNGVKLKYVLQGMRKSNRIDDQDWFKYIEKRKAENWIPIKYDKKQNKMIPIKSGKMFTKYKRRLKDEEIDQW